MHSLGFKLVPISEDGVSPIIQWTKVYENGWDTNDLANVYFPNVATCFGKTRIKDKENRELYLNCLDIDSQDVFTRLAIIIDEKGLNFLKMHNEIAELLQTPVRESRIIQ